MIGQRLEKAKQIAKKKFFKIHLYDIFSDDWIQRELGSMRKTGTRCSCHGCGNPRKWFGEKTYQERKSDIAFQEYQNA